MSQKWADSCVYEHGGIDGVDNISPYTSIGQNLAVGTRPESKSGVTATDLWHDEEEFYDYNNDYCRPGEMCGHYTQVSRCFYIAFPPFSSNAFALQINNQSQNVIYKYVFIFQIFLSHIFFHLIHSSYF